MANDKVSIWGGLARFGRQPLQGDVLIGGSDGTFDFVNNVLSADRTYYVETTGSDSNDGLSASTPFLTIQKAVAVIYTLNMNGHSITIQVADGTYTLASQVLFSGMPDGAGPSSVIYLRGNVATPANVVLQTSSFSGSLVSSTFGAILNMGGFNIAHSSGPGNLDGVSAGNGGLLWLDQPMEFGACGRLQIEAWDKGSVYLSSSIAVTGGAAQFLSIGSGGSLQCLSAPTITFGADVSYSNAVVIAYACGAAFLNISWAGSTPTGKRYDAALNGVIVTETGDPYYIPGTVDGTSTSGGQYA